MSASSRALSGQGSWRGAAGSGSSPPPGALPHRRRLPLTAAEVVEGGGAASAAGARRRRRKPGRRRARWRGGWRRPSTAPWRGCRSRVGAVPAQDVVLRAAAPPRRPRLLALVSHAAARMGPVPRALSADEARAVDAASRGFPCTTYFIDGKSSSESNHSGISISPILLMLPNHEIFQQTRARTTRIQSKFVTIVYSFIVSLSLRQFLIMKRLNKLAQELLEFGTNL